MILSTKKLSPIQKQRFINSGFKLIDYDAIQVELCDFKAPKKIENAIFTSKNAVQSFFSPHNLNFSIIENVFCVGAKTESLLIKNGQNVVKKSENASQLGDFLSKYEKYDAFYFFCGNLKREEIPNALKNAKKKAFEINTYKTDLKHVKFDQKWTKILFFSPSGVQSFVSENRIENSVAVCIGKTTASEAKKYTNNIVIADSAEVESVIDTAIKNIITS